MPGIMIERPKMTRSTYRALKKHIISEREKKKQEQAQEDRMEKIRKQKELDKQKKDEETITLEQTKEQLTELNVKLEKLKQEKHELFRQLKKVLHFEDENRKKAQIQEQSEMVSMAPHQMTHAQGGLTSSHHPYLQSKSMHMNMSGRPQMTMPITRPMPSAGHKRARTPSPPPPKQPAIYYAKVPVSSTYAGSQQPPKQESLTYPTSSGQKPHAAYASHAPQVTYVTQARTTAAVQTTYASGQTTNTSQSAFSNYSSHYPAATRLVPSAGDQPHYRSSTGAAAYPAQRAKQPQGYMGSGLHQQLDHSTKPSAYGDKGVRSAAAAPVSHHSQVSGSAPQTKPGIMSGYPMRTYSATATSQAGSQRSGYSGQQGRFY